MIAEEQALAIRSIEDFYTFVVLNWRYAGTREPLKRNWYIEAVCDHLQALNCREIRNLAIGISPRHGKSTIVSVLYPIWCWLREPKEQFLTGTNVARLAIRDAVRSRNLIESSRFKELYKPDWQLKADQNEKSRYNNTEGGYRYTTSIDSTVTGEGCDHLVIDDPHDANDFSSANKLDAAIEWYANKISTRYNSPETFVKLLIHQRIGENDLIGYVLREERGDWEYLLLEEEYTGRNRYTTKIGWSDPRKVGELLAPNLLGREAVAKLKRKAVMWETQYQQNPTPISKSIVDVQKILQYDFDLDTTNMPLFISVDARQGGLAEGSSFFVLQLWGIKKEERYLVEQVRVQCGFTEALKEIEKAADRYNPENIIIENKADGKALADSLQLYRDGRYKERLVMFKPNLYGDKVQRLSGCSDIIDEHWVRIPKFKKWTAEFIEEISKFPRSLHDDQVDAMTQFLLWHRQELAIKISSKKTATVVQDFNELYRQKISTKINSTQLFECNGITNKEIRSLFD